MLKAWRNKTQAKKQNWFMLCLVALLLSAGFVDAYTWVAILGAIPAATVLTLECIG